MLCLVIFASILLSVKSLPNFHRWNHLDSFSDKGRIVGGHPVKIEDHPYQVSLQVQGFHICGGSIISKDVILTAGHCTSSYQPSTLSVRVGSHRKATGGVIHQVASVILHEQFGHNSRGVLVNDVALLKLKSPIELNDKAQPISLFDQDEESPDGSLATVSGWGNLRSGGTPPEVLYAVDVPIVSKQVCDSAYKPTHGGLPNGQICAALPEGGKDSCQGDSGGPLAIGGRLAGIVSWGRGCARQGFPGVYTEVATFRDWIVEHVDGRI